MRYCYRGIGIGQLISEAWHSMRRWHNFIKNIWTLFYLSSHRDQYLLLPAQVYAAEIWLELVYLQEALGWRNGLMRSVIEIKWCNQIISLPIKLVVRLRIIESMVNLKPRLSLDCFNWVTKMAQVKNQLGS